MARWHFEQVVDLARPDGPRTWPDLMMVEGDQDAHQWRVDVLDGGQAADMSGYNAVAYFARADGNTVVQAAAIHGNAVTVTMPQQAYAVPGPMVAVIRATAGGQTVTLAKGRCMVQNGPGDSYVDPGHTVPTLDELLAEIAAMEQATASANAAAQAADEARAGIQGDLQAVNDSVDQLKSDLCHYNSKNLASDFVKINNTHNGVTWTFQDNTVTVRGTVTGSGSIVYLNGNADDLPVWFRSGDTYYIKYASELISLVIYDKTSGTSKNIFSTQKDAVFTVPDGMTRGSIRLYAPSGAAVDETVTLPVFLSAPTNQELSQKIGDVDQKISDVDRKTDLKKGVLPYNTDLNSVTENGMYVLNSGFAYVNSPKPVELAGILEIFKASDNTILQRVTCPLKGNQYVRNSISGSFAGRAWAETTATEYNNTYVTEHYENSYNISCTPTIQANADYLLPSTNDTTDRTGDIQTLLNTTGACRLGKGVYYVTGITIPTGGMLTGSGKGTRLVLADSVTDGYAVKIGTFGTVRGLSICGADSWSTKADDITNDVGTRDGLIFEGLASTSGAVPYRSTVEDVMFYNLSGSAIRCENTGLSPASCLNVSDVYAFWCGCGVNIAYFSEFNRFTNVSVDGCGYGCINNGGNNVFANCAFNNNNVGILMDNSTGQSRNNSHGTFSGCTINHSGGNTGTAIKMVGMANGHLFSACQIFYGKIVIDSCVGVRFVGANIGRQVPMEITNSKVVVFSDCTMYDNDASPLTQSGNTTLKFSGCYCRDGSVFDPMAT